MEALLLPDFPSEEVERTRIEGRFVGDLIAFVESLLAQERAPYTAPVPVMDLSHETDDEDFGEGVA
jgi:hypothetical protein